MSSDENEVCLLDDDASVLQSMNLLLASEGFKVRSFETAEHFLSYATKNKVPLLITDVWMDKITGLEVLARLCAISPETRTIVITAREDLAARAIATTIGPVAYFIKPFDDDAFIAAVRQALEKPSTA